MKLLDKISQALMNPAVDFGIMLILMILAVLVQCWGGAV